MVLLLLLKATPAAGQAGLNRAGLVVRHGDGRVTYAYVPFPEEEIKAVPAESPRFNGPGAVMLRFSLGAGRGGDPDEG